MLGAWVNDRDVRLTMDTNSNDGGIGQWHSTLNFICAVVKCVVFGKVRLVVLGGISFWVEI